MQSARSAEKAGDANAARDTAALRRPAQRSGGRGGVRAPRGGEIVLRMAAATVVFAAMHSVLASEGAKQRAVRLAGPARGTALYRIFFNLQAVVSFGMLLRYGSRLPAATVYHVQGRRRRLLRLLQGAGWAWGLWAVREVGIARLSGVDTVRGLWSRGDAPAPPAAQGPEQGASGRFTRGGPFRWSRHPLNLAPLPVIWATPHMTFRRLGFNLVATAYFAVGSFHEERRLARRYGEAYERYRLSAPFYLPCPPSLYRVSCALLAHAALTVRTTPERRR